MCPTLGFCLGGRWGRTKIGKYYFYILYYWNIFVQSVILCWCCWVLTTVLVTMVFLEPDYSQDSRPAGDDTPVPVSCSLQLQRDIDTTKSQDMKPDLNTSLSISGEMSPLPFSMPKLERKLKDKPGLPLALQARPNLSLSLASKQPRPTSLHTSTPTRTSALRLSLHNSGINTDKIFPIGKSK